MNEPGWGQFYRYDTNGEMINEITKGNFVAGNGKNRYSSSDNVFHSFGREEGEHHTIEHLYSVSMGTDYST